MCVVVCVVWVVLLVRTMLVGRVVLVVMVLVTCMCMVMVLVIIVVCDDVVVLIVMLVFLGLLVVSPGWWSWC